MDIYNETPFPTHIERESVENPPLGKVVAFSKITYAVNPLGGLTYSGDQVPLYTEACDEAPHGDLQMLMVPELVDITVVGTVRAPRGRPVAQRDVELSWDGESRRIRLYGERVWRRDAGGTLTKSSPEPFTELPMRWEVAYGGKYPSGA